MCVRVACIRLLCSSFLYLFFYCVVWIRMAVLFIWMHWILNGNMCRNRRKIRFCYSMHDAYCAINLVRFLCWLKNHMSWTENDLWSRKNLVMIANNNFHKSQKSLHSARSNMAVNMACGQPRIPRLWCAYRTAGTPQSAINAPHNDIPALTTANCARSTVNLSASFDVV